MALGLLTTPAAASRRVVRASAPAVGKAAGALAGTARAGVRGADVAVQIGRAHV